MKKMYLLLVIFLAGCVQPVTPVVLTEEEEMYANETMVCKTSEGCGLYWSRSQEWLSTSFYNNWKIRLVTDTVIETYGPLRGKIHWAYQIIKSKNADDSYIIDLKMSCGAVQCAGDERKIRANFVRYVLTGKNFSVPVL